MGALSKGKHVTVVDDQLVRGRTCGVLRHPGQARDPLALEQESMALAEPVQGICRRVGCVRDPDLNPEIVGGRSNRPEFGCGDIAEFVHKGHRDVCLCALRDTGDPACRLPNGDPLSGPLAGVGIPVLCLNCECDRHARGRHLDTGYL